MQVKGQPGCAAFLLPADKTELGNLTLTSSDNFHKSFKKNHLSTPFISSQGVVSSCLSSACRLQRSCTAVSGLEVLRCASVGVRSCSSPEREQ